MTLSLDLAGEGLHRRGYRIEAGEAPLRENLAAGLLLRARWPEAAQRGAEFLDPMCGSGTLVIEAAMIAARRAPGLRREYFGFLGWKGHDAALWQRLKNEARAALRTEIDEHHPRQRHRSARARRSPLPMPSAPAWRRWCASNTMPVASVRAADAMRRV